MVLTSVVPPELPMELSLAVNTSLAALYRVGIVCTEPFRIPFAGKVDVCCFDKTGTLTSDDFVVEGISHPDTNNLLPISESSPFNISILGGCHSLVKIRGKVAGDPLEVTAFEASQWSFVGDDVFSGPITLEANAKHVSYKVVRRYPFSSDLKRMSTLLTSQEGGSSRKQNLRLVSKGAPEVLENLLKEIPSGYRQSHQYYSQVNCFFY
jgi:cation-transporting ATPase 13A1